MNPTTALRTAWRERLSSPIALHSIGLSTLVLLIVGMIVWLCIDLTALDTRASAQLTSKAIELRALAGETIPLRGLDKRVIETQRQIEAFYANRIPADYSSIAFRIGELGVKSGVRLSNVQYSQGPAGSDLTEISMEAGISGDYPQIIRFVNELERDQNFFVIRNMVLQGQEGAQVSLRLHASTWLRPAAAAASGLPAKPKASETVARPAASGQEGE